MTPKGANNAVIISTMVTLGSTTGSSLTKGNGIHSKTVVGGFFAMAGCAVLTELNPDLGGYLAIMIAGGAFTLYGLPLLNEMFPSESGIQKVNKAIAEHGGFPTEAENKRILEHAKRGEKEISPGVFKRG